MADLLSAGTAAEVRRPFSTDTIYLDGTAFNARIIAADDPSARPLRSAYRRARPRSRRRIPGVAPERTHEPDEERRLPENPDETNPAPVPPAVPDVDRDANLGPRIGQVGALGSALVKPRLRGVFHQWAFVVSLFAGVFLVLRATTTLATVAAAVYAAGVSGLFGVSALYHRITWRPNVRRWLRQLDHAMIFVLIAGTYTPVGLLVLKGGLGVTVLALVWGGAIAGITLNLVRDVPKWLAAIVYVALGWVAVVTMPQLLERMGVAGVVLIVLGGLVYSVGALVYATRRPNPVPAVFGYHEVFHLLVIAGVAFHFAAITMVVLAGTT
jgi:hemolysin III